MGTGALLWGKAAGV